PQGPVNTVLQPRQPSFAETPGALIQDIRNTNAIARQQEYVVKKALGGSLPTFDALKEAGARTVANPNTLYSVLPPSWGQGPSAYVRDVQFQGENFKVVYGQVPRPDGVGNPVAAVQTVSRAPARSRHDSLAASDYFNNLSYTFREANKTAIVNTGLLALDAATLGRAGAVKPRVPSP